MPGEAPLSIYQGDDFGLLVTFMSPGANPGDPAVPLPLDGYTFRAQIRPLTADADQGAAPIAEALCELVDVSSVRVSIAHDVTQEFPTAKPLHWDLEGADENGWVTTYLAGPVQVTAEVTR
jgi:hypothetical protein